jgi:catechol 2,3-dioxygenase-like lactoylglutathione lyase family enzyme
MNQHPNVALPSSALTGLHHVRLTVTDIDRSKTFYSRLLGIEPAIDFTREPIESGVRSDPLRFFGGCTFSFNGHLLGLRPVAQPDDRFDSASVGLDHLSFGVRSVSDLRHAADALEAFGVENGGVVDLPELKIAILSFQDPDDINLELVATTGG